MAPPATDKQASSANQAPPGIGAAKIEPPPKRDPREKFRRFWHKRKFAPAELQDSDVLRLRAKEIRSLDELWKKVGGDPDRGIDTVGTDVGIEKLKEILINTCQKEREPGGVWWLEWFARHMLDWIIFGGALLVLLLFLRAQGCLSDLPAPWGFAPVSARHYLISMGSGGSEAGRRAA